MSQTITSSISSNPAHRLAMPGSPLGVAWFFLYGHSGVPAVTYLPQLRELGAGLTKVYLFWQQIEPEQGHFDWTATDAFVNQLRSPEEGLISIFSSSMWAVKQPSIMLPPSPAKNLDDYYRFVHAVVSRYRGKVRYWQNDCEPNSPVYWSGTKEEFTAQLRVFHRAVRDADPSAVVVVGGYDGLFLPPGFVPLPGQHARPFPGQQVGLDFFEYVLQEGADAFDVFDLRLYGDPYTIVARVEYFRQRMSALGCHQPIICTEYGGPNFFEFAENRKYISMISTWSQAIGQTNEKGEPVFNQAGGNLIDQLYTDMATLAPQTQMFMQGCSPALEAKYYRLQARSLVVRNLLAFAAGVQKMIYWQLLAASGARNDLMTLMYGKIGLLGTENNALTLRSPTADIYARMGRALAGVTAVTRVDVSGFPLLFLFKVERGSRGPLYVAWERRDAFAGEDSPDTACQWSWSAPGASATDTFGESIPVRIHEGQIHLPVSLTPVYIEPSS